ncbi:MAG: DUF1800 domain-containing protein [Deltaproteobacteria bacterium]|nr:DUF1800 domain-containing protein [Deltaproteobacteria bacterium]
MGDQNTSLDESSARHLLRRTGFGAPAANVAAFTGLTRGAAADQLLNFTPAKFKPRGVARYDDSRAEFRAHNSWVKYMITTKLQLQEKLVLFWHDHFANNNDKVGDHSRMSDQNKLFRQFCKGNFKDFVKAVNKDGAMMEFLDTVRNFKDEPNENYARELQELFTLGVKDLSGSPNYAQEDIVQIARAFSGWAWDNKPKAHFNDYDHDYATDFPGRGAKVIYQTHGQFGAAGRDFTQPAGEGAAEIDQVIDIIFQHRDSDAKNTVARYIAAKLLEYFAHPLPAYPAKASIVDGVVSRSGFGASFDIGALVREILVDDFFYETGVGVPFGPTTPKSVKWPIDYVVSTLRLLKMRPKGGDAYINGGSYHALQDQLKAMGQQLFEPPSVFGWNWELSWMSSATLLARCGFARDLISARGSGRFNFHPEKLIDLGLTQPTDIVQAVTDLLGVTDQLTATEITKLVEYLGAGPIDLHDYDTRNRKLNGLFGLVLQSPAYQLH